MRSPQPFKQETLQKLFEYREGELYWKVDRRGNLVAGRRAGSRHKFSNGAQRWIITINNRHYYRSRLIWLLVHGEWPNELDHRNRNPLDDRIENLRPAIHSFNNANCAGRASSGVKGVYAHGRGWQSKINVDGRSVYLGKFDSKEEAQKAFRNKHREVYGTFSCTIHRDEEAAA
jgi:HNH endonuclease